MSLKTISSPRLFETIAAQVRDLIKDEDLALGAKLPNERELAQRCCQTNANQSPPGQ